MDAPWTLVDGVKVVTVETSRADGSLEWRAQVKAEEHGGTYSMGPCTYQDGNLSMGPYITHGLVERWHPDGSKAERGEYRDGKKIGMWVYWNPDGTQLRQEVHERSTRSR
jgi:hypothetical protein